MITTAMQMIQGVDATDVKAAGTLFVLNWAAMTWGDILFQAFIGLGSAGLLWQTVRGKYLDNELKKRQIEDHDEAKRDSNS
jgi:hypothetical protein